MSRAMLAALMERFSELVEGVSGFMESLAPTFTGMSKTDTFQSIGNIVSRIVSRQAGRRAHVEIQEKVAVVTAPGASNDGAGGLRGDAAIGGKSATNAGGDVAFVACKNRGEDNGLQIGGRYSALTELIQFVGTPPAPGWAMQTPHAQVLLGFFA